MHRRTTAPDIDNAISYHNCHGSSSFEYNEETFDDKTYVLADLLFSLTERLEPRGEDGARSLYLRAPRGEPEDYMSFRDWKEECGGKKKDYLEYWRSLYPDDYCWYRLTTYTFTEKGRTFKAIWIGGSLVFQYDDSLKKKERPENDISWLLAWAIDEVHRALYALERGTYNETVRKGLPYSLRTGTINEKELWEVFPEAREELQGPFSEEDLREFDRCAKEQDDDPSTAERIPVMTTNDYYGYCAMGYKAMGRSGTDLPPKEQYLRNSDGRDRGLRDIDPDSPEAFEKWIHDAGKYDHHQWEAIVGLHLYVSDRGGEGYLLSLSCPYRSMTTEVVKFYLALHRAGVPVHLWDAKQIADRLNGEGIIGIVP